MDEIVSIPKGSISNPSVYLSNEYIEHHLKQFDNGGSFVITRDQYEWYVEGNSFIGFDDNTQFIAPKDFMDNIEKVAKTDISVYEKMLGFDEGYFQLIREQRGDSPFRLNMEKILNNNREALMRNKENMIKYRKLSGEENGNGLWDDVIRIDTLCKRKWNISIL